MALDKTTPYNLDSVIYYLFDRCNPESEIEILRGRYLFSHAIKVWKEKGHEATCSNGVKVKDSCHKNKL